VSPLAGACRSSCQQIKLIAHGVYRPTSKPSCGDGIVRLASERSCLVRHFSLQGLVPVRVLANAFASVVAVLAVVDSVVVWWCKEWKMVKLAGELQN